jgi:hypothetical protein
MTRISFSSANDTSNFEKTTSTLVFAGILILCSLAVGCSSEKPKTQSSINQTAITQPTPPAAVMPPSLPTLAAPVAAKPVHKKAGRRVPPTVTYADESTGVSFQYPRKYALKTGDAADRLVSADAVAMDFVQPGGVAVAAVAVPESSYPKSDLASALFTVSVNKALTVEQCGEFSVPKASATGLADAPMPATPQSSKVTIGEMELHSTETLASNGSRDEAAKYYHVFENGACYEFALTVATGVETDEGGKHSDREEIFKRLEKILATVKINAVSAPEVTASTPAAVPVTPAQ